MRVFRVEELHLEEEQGRWEGEVRRRGDKGRRRGAFRLSCPPCPNRPRRRCQSELAWRKGGGRGSDRAEGVDIERFCLEDSQVGGGSGEGWWRNEKSLVVHKLAFSFALS